MNVRILGRTIPLTTGRLMAIVITVVGAILLLVAYGANADIVEIGETPDPVLQERIAQLEDERNLGVIAGIGFGFLGLFGMAVLGEASSPRSVSEDEMISTARASGDIIRALQLSGNAVYLPAKHGLTKERIFIPGGKGQTTLPTALSEDLALSPGKDGSSPGVVLEPLGARLLDRTEREVGTQLSGVGLETAEGTLQMMKHGYSLMRDFHFKERDGKTVMRVEYKDLLEACRTVRKERPDTCRQMACIGCACLLTAATRATGKAVVVESVDNSKDNVVYTLELREW
jgi:hypothetical protein